MRTMGGAPTPFQHFKKNVDDIHGRAPCVGGTSKARQRRWGGPSCGPLSFPKSPEATTVIHNHHKLRVEIDRRRV